MSNRRRDFRRMMVVIPLIPLMLLAEVSIASEMSFQDAKEHADQIESNLSNRTLQGLVEAQGRLAKAAFPYCLSETELPPTDFTVVVELDSDGRVARSWLDQDTAWGRCFRERMVADFLFTSQIRPFFTSFEYKNKR